jgi:hypothetical protein
MFGRSVVVEDAVCTLAAEFARLRGWSVNMATASSPLFSKDSAAL